MRAACYCGTRNLYEDMVPAVKSLLKNSNVDKVYLLIEDDDFPFYMPEEVEWINVSKQTYFHPDGPNFHNSWTYMVLMRAALHRVFPQLDEVLSLDVDTFAVKDINGIWDYPLDKYWLAAVKEPFKSRYITYVNCGVMRMNLKKLRDDGKGDELIEALNTKRYGFNEQDCIADRCQGGILEISSEYNWNHYTDQTGSPRIVHFAAVKKYQGQPLVQIYRDMSWGEVMRGR